jgi:hypothetical protein
LAPRVADNALRVIMEFPKKKRPEHTLALLLHQ